MIWMSPLSPSDWAAWDEMFGNKARTRRLWARIDPTIDGKDVLVKPGKPKTLRTPALSSSAAYVSIDTAARLLVNLYPDG